MSLEHKHGNLWRLLLMLDKHGIIGGRDLYISPFRIIKQKNMLSICIQTNKLDLFNAI